MWHAKISPRLWWKGETWKVSRLHFSKALSSKPEINPWARWLLNQVLHFSVYCRTRPGGLWWCWSFRHTMENHLWTSPSLSPLEEVGGVSMCIATPTACHNYRKKLKLCMLYSYRYWIGCVTWIQPFYEGVEGSKVRWRRHTTGHSVTSCIPLVAHSHKHNARKESL